MILTMVVISVKLLVLFFVIFFPVTLFLIQLKLINPIKNITIRYILTIFVWIIYILLFLTFSFWIKNMEG